MCSSPAKALSQRHQRAFGQVEVGDQQNPPPGIAKPGVIEVARIAPWCWPLGSTANSSVRTVVVPTASTRQPRLAAALQGGQHWPAEISYHSLCIWCSAQISRFLPGWEGASAHVQGDAGRLHPWPGGRPARPHRSAGRRWARPRRRAGGQTRFGSARHLRQHRGRGRWLCWRSM